MLVSSKELLDAEKATGRAIPAYNVYNLETIEAVFRIAKARESPVIVSFGESYLKHADFATIRAIVEARSLEHPYPVCLHLDHCKKIEHIRAAIAAGFSSVMFDGSALPLGENIALSREVVSLARAAGISVEGELGGMNPESGEEPADAAQLRYTQVADVEEYVSKAGVDSLAVSVGNAHGLYKDKPHLNMERIAEISRVAGIPLVLHGSSGIPTAQIAKAITLGIAKINVNTELAIAAASAAKTVLDAKRSARFEELALAAVDAMVAAADPYLAVCRNPRQFLAG